MISPSSSGFRPLAYRMLALATVLFGIWSAILPSEAIKVANDDSMKRTSRKSMWFPDDPSVATSLGVELAHHFSGSEPVWDYVSTFLPSPAETVALLARDRDVDNFEESSEVGGEAGEHYDAVVSLVPVMRPLRESYVAFFSALHAGMVKAGLAQESDGSANPIADKGRASPPSRRSMDISHTYALDIFLSDVIELPGSKLEVGPDIYSSSGGIVISTASDWKGEAGIETYRGGGISPNAGNGVIIFDPENLRFYCYFHLYDVRVEPGMPVSRGSVIGRGGDTGSNARKPGHGQHLHLEIFDARAGRFLRNTEIRELVF